MTYYESANGEIITKDRAIQELIKHGCIPEENGTSRDGSPHTQIRDFPDFVDDLGERDFYTAQEVLNWLGY